MNDMVSNGLGTYIPHVVAVSASLNFKVNLVPRIPKRDSLY